MPELPEVETIKNELSPWVVGQHFDQVSVLDSRLIYHLPVPEFCRRLTGQAIETINRRGKYLIFQLSGAQYLVVHLRMSGALLLNPSKTEPYARASFTFSNGTHLILIDQRRLGIMWLVENIEPIIGKLGPEPLENDFTVDVLSQTLSKHHIPIKVALIDQSLIAGIGNMYADEILFAARMHPLRTTDSLSTEEIQHIHNSIRRILRSAIARKGASTDTYVRPGGQLGTAHFDFKVAHRKGMPCPVCGAFVERISLRNRGTYFCPTCQPLTTRMPPLPPCP
ncbi:Formamidopyrimidine-DNA glycosylase [subsurface metagenome]